MSQLLKDDFLPISAYNSLPNIRDVSDVHETNSEDLTHLQSLLDKHDLSAKVSLKLVHIHFPLHEGEIMAFNNINVDPHGPIPVLGPIKPAESTSKFYGSHYLVDSSGQLQAWEYMTAPGPDMSQYASFISEFCQAIIQRGLQHKFGLSLKSSVEEGEFEYPQKRATFIVPDTISLPDLENSFITTTEWPRECFKPALSGVSYQHWYHCSHPPKKQFEKLELGAEPDYGFVEGISCQDGLFLAGVKLDPGSPFHDVVAAITVGV
ncbi:hypothetical protein VE00_02915 [Pseudogymnoascus sp. WSF 3629]|nr:hypothetical protein VE00_02915 [Pseudogymnoascus sp. WSF 3629]